MVYQAPRNDFSTGGADKENKKVLTSSLFSGVLQGCSSSADRQKSAHTKINVFSIHFTIIFWFYKKFQGVLRLPPPPKKKKKKYI